MTTKRSIYLGIHLIDKDIVMTESKGSYRGSHPEEIIDFYNSKYLNAIQTVQSEADPSQRIPKAYMLLESKGEARLPRRINAKFYRLSSVHHNPLQGMIEDYVEVDMVDSPKYDFVIFVQYKTKHLFALTSGDGYRAVDPFLNLEFPFEIAKKILDGNISRLIMEHSQGDIRLSAAIYREPRALTPTDIPGSSGPKSFSCKIKTTSSLYGLPMFNEKKSPFVEVSKQRLRIRKKLSIEELCRVCIRMSKILRGKTNDQNFYFGQPQASNDPTRAIEEQVSENEAILEAALPQDENHHQLNENVSVSEVQVPNIRESVPSPINRESVLSNIDLYSQENAQLSRDADENQAQEPEIRTIISSSIVISQEGILSDRNINPSPFKEIDQLGTSGHPSQFITQATLGKRHSQYQMEQYDSEDRDGEQEENEQNAKNPFGWTSSSKRGSRLVKKKTYKKIKSIPSTRERETKWSQSSTSSLFQTGV